MGQKDVNGTDLKKKKLLTFITNTIVYLLAKFVRANGYLSIQSQPVHNIARDQNTRMGNKNQINRKKQKTNNQTNKKIKQKSSATGKGNLSKWLVLPSEFSNAEKKYCNLHRNRPTDSRAESKH